MKFNIIAFLQKLLYSFKYKHCSFITLYFKYLCLANYIKHLYLQFTKNIYNTFIAYNNNNNNNNNNK